MATKREATEYSKAVGSVIFGLYKTKRWNQAKLAEKIGVTGGTLRRMIAGEAEITARVLRLIAAVLGTTADAILDAALEEYGGLDRLVAEATNAGEMSEAGDSNVTPLRIRDMTVEQHETFEGERAALAFDEEADQPEQ